MVVGEMANKADLVIIGGGPGGYHAAIRAAQLGRQVTLVEKADLGGICLNKGCIPSKVLTEAARRLADSRRNAIFGIKSDGLAFDFNQLKDYQLKTIQGLRSGVEALCKANKIHIIRGTAFFQSETRIGVEEGDHYELYDFNQAIIAAGVRPSKEGHRSGGRVIDTWSISFLDQIPGHLAIYGSEPIQLEMAFAYRTMGSKVTLMLPTEGGGLPYDSSISKELLRILKKEKIAVMKDCFIEEVVEEPHGVNIAFTTQTKTDQILATHFFNSKKMASNSSELGLARIGIRLDNEGFAIVDSQCRTESKHIFAIGDITGRPFLASKAIKQGKVAAEAACGIQSSITEFSFLPQIAFTLPPIACTGLTEEQAVERGLDIKVSQFPLLANGFSSLSGKREGFVKLISERGTDVIHGIHIIGEGAHELMFGGVLGLELGAREEDLLFPSYPHPGLAEALLEAAEGLEGKAVHLKPALINTAKREPVIEQ